MFFPGPDPDPHKFADPDPQNCRSGPKKVLYLGTRPSYRSHYTLTLCVLFSVIKYFISSAAYNKPVSIVPRDGNLAAVADLWMFPRSISKISYKVNAFFKFKI